MKLLVDGDAILYRSGFATDRNKYLVAFADGTYQGFDDAKSANEHKGAGVLIWSRKDTDPEDKALLITDLLIGDIYARFASENPGVVVVLGGVGNWRHGVATRSNYKGSRSGLPPAHSKAIRQHLITKHGALLTHSQEADDLICQLWYKDKQSVICAQDKDFAQIPARIYNFVTKEELKVSLKDSVINFYSQVISGDAVDSIPGATGYGPVKARKALEGCKSAWDCWQQVLAIYIKEYGDISGVLFALETAQLVYLRREEGISWVPPTATLSKNASGSMSKSQLGAGNGKAPASLSAMA